MQRIDQARNDYRTQAEITAGGEASRDYGMDAESRRTAIAEILAQRQTPLNEITALMSGSQVSNPFAQASAFNTGAVAQPTPVLAGAIAQDQANMDRYNVGAAGAGNMMSGLFGLGSSAIGAKWGK
jgi:hypothetical protein